MSRSARTRVTAGVAGLLLALSSFGALQVADAAGVSTTVDGSRTFQTISGLGADINPHSWDNGNLKPALDLLIDKEGMKTFRVGMDMIDWESTNDDSDPSTFNWAYYDPIYSGQKSFDTQYAGSNFADTWNVIDYLHQKGIPDSGIELSFMGPGPAWMGGNSLTPGMEDEFVEEVLSAAYYGYSHGHTFGLFSPDNEMDISANEGVTMSDTQYADVLNRLAGRMNALGMGGVQLIGPETCCNVGYAGPMTSYPALMGRLDHFDFHNYVGGDNGAAAAVAGSGKDFWISEYANWDQTFGYLDQGASGLQMWEAYDSVYNHAVLNGRGSDPGNDSLSFGDVPLIAYDAITKTYIPRSEFYYFGQLFKWVPIGAQRIYADSNSSDVKIEAFLDPATSRLTLVGMNGSNSAQTVSVALTNVATPTTLQYFQTNSDSDMAQGPDVPVSGGRADLTVPADTTFTLTGLGVPDTQAPTAPSNLTATGGVASVSLNWGASSDNVAVTRYDVYRSSAPGVAPSDASKVGQSSTTSFTDTALAAGTYYYSVVARDAAGNASPPSNEASATATAGGTQLLGLNSIQPAGDNDAGGEAEAFRFVATGSGPARTATAYVDGSSTATTLIVGIYDDAGGQPGALLAAGSLPGPRPAAWNTVTLDLNPAIASGTPYWIAVLGTGGRLDFRDAATGGCSQSNATVGLAKLPDAWSSGTSWDSCDLSAYVSSAPDTTLPSVTITAPTNGTSVAGIVPVVAATTGGVAGVQFKVDGADVGVEDRTAPYVVRWNTATVGVGRHTLTAAVFGATGDAATSRPTTVVVRRSPPVLDTRVTTHQSVKRRSITSPALTTAGPRELLVAFVASDGPSRSGAERISSVTGGHLPWTLRKRANTRYGTAEIWTAPAFAVVRRITVTVTRSSGSYTGSITVAAFRNARLTVGATGRASATSGAPTARLVATTTGSIVWGVGNDASRVSTRRVGAGQALVDQYLSAGSRDTFWVQRLIAPSVAGRTRTISDTAPTNDQWNLATIEIVPPG